MNLVYRDPGDLFTPSQDLFKSPILHYRDEKIKRLAVSSRRGDLLSSRHDEEAGGKEQKRGNNEF